MKAIVFPGQGAQFVGMGKDLYENNEKAKKLFDEANEILGFQITNIMFNGTEDELKQTKVTQPAVFLHSVIQALCEENLNPEMVAGHSLGEFSALVINGVLSFKDGLTLVSKRALAMQEACEINPSGMAAIIGMEDHKVEEICGTIADVVPANYNCPGQLVISGSKLGIETACVTFKEQGAKRALPLPVSGGFHSPMMEPARTKLEQAILETTFSSPTCPIYQNYTASPSSDVDEIRKNLILQLTGPVKWTQSVQNMISDGATLFVESGPGKVLQGLVKKIDKSAEVAGL